MPHLLTGCFPFSEPPQPLKLPGPSQLCCPSASLLEAFPGDLLPSSQPYPFSLGTPALPRAAAPTHLGAFGAPVPLGSFDARG